MLLNPTASPVGLNAELGGTLFGIVGDVLAAHSRGRAAHADEKLVTMLVTGREGPAPWSYSFGRA